MCEQYTDGGKWVRHIRRLSCNGRLENANGNFRYVKLQFMIFGKFALLHTLSKRVFSALLEKEH